MFKSKAKAGFIQISESPIEKAGIFSQLHFAWVIPFMRAINKVKTAVTIDMIPHLGVSECSQRFRDRFLQEYKKARNHNHSPASSVNRAIVKSLWKILFYSFIGQVIFVVSRILYGLLLNGVLNSLADESQSASDAYKLAFWLFVTIIVSLYGRNHRAHTAERASVMLKLGIVSMVYKKCTSVSLSAIQSLSVGKIVNLVANDVNLFDSGLSNVLVFLSSPVAIIGSTVLLWDFFGPSCLIGLGFIVLTMPIQSFMTQRSKKPRSLKNQATDERIKLTNEVIEGVKLLKMYTWEVKFRDMIQEVRNKEIKFLKKMLYLDYTNKAIALGSQAISSFLIFLPFYLEGGELTSSIIFPTVFLMNFVRYYAILIVLDAYAFILEAQLFFTRVGEVLEIPEKNQQAEQPKNSDNAVEFEDYTAYWTPSPDNKMDDDAIANTSRPCLNGIDLELKKGSLTAIVGLSGSGKSTLLLSLIGELPRSSGSLRYEGKVAYVEQEPLIFPGTLKENILFGNDYDANYYNKVIEACSLKDDLKKFANGDETEIGERGINLSGGQKARLALARAIYSRADIYLLDDPLSAVDSKVANCLFEKAIRDLLKEKTVLLVTHHIQLTQFVDKIIVMNNGQVLTSGTYMELESQGHRVDRILKENRRQKREKSEVYSKNSLNSPLRMLSILSEASEPSSPNPKFNKRSLSSLNNRLSPHRKPQKADTEIEPFTLDTQKSKESFVSKDTNTEDDEVIPEPTGQLEKKESKLQKYGTYNQLEEIEEEEDDEELGECINSDDSEDIPPVDPEKGKLVIKESTQEGDVTLQTYKQYFSAIFSPLSFIIWIISLAACELLLLAYNRFLGYWADETIKQSLAATICGILTVVLLLVRLYTLIFWIVCSLNGTNKLHKQMLSRVIGSPLLFFETNPVGRILNRFSTDMGIVDRSLPSSFFDTAQGIIYFLTLFITVWVLNPIIAIPGMISIGLYIWVCRFSAKSMRETKGLELITRSPVYSFFSMTLSGLIPIRVYNQADRFIQNFTKRLDENAKASYYYWHTTRVLCFYIEFAASIYIIVGLAILISMKDPNSDSGLVGLSASYLLSITETLTFVFRQFINTDMMMASSARVISYSTLPTEAALELPNDKTLKQNSWPNKGEIVFKNVYMRYRPELPHTIKGLNLKINAGETIGCVGRTGAGKSSVIQLLFRMVELDKSEEIINNSILIDGVDTETVGLHALRGGISIIPQTPLIFSGTMRQNLDPFGKYSDEEIWEVLGQLGLKSEVRRLEKKLDTMISPESVVLSVGEKQLLCLARVMLQKNKILLMDEATANIDFATDSFIQRKIFETFPECTIFTIAHRIVTIAHYDKVLVLDKGELAEFDVPFLLLVKNISDNEITNTEGIFASMVLNGGPKVARFIFETCKKRYFEKFGKEKPSIQLEKVLS